MWSASGLRSNYQEAWGAFMKLALAGIALAKLVAVSGEEILAKSVPHDQLWHVLAAARRYWFGDHYDNMTLIHLPVYPLWVAAIRTTGIPLRIAIELAYLAAGWLFIGALVRAGLPRRWAVAGYAMIAFNPYSFELFNQTLAETLYGPLLLAALAGTIYSLVEQDRGRGTRCALFGGGCYALLWNLRKENLLLVGIFAFVALVLAARSRSGKTPGTALGGDVFRLVLAPLAVVGVVTGLLMAVTYAKFGIAATSEMTAPGYAAAYRALLRIRPERSIRFVPISKDARAKGYRVSAALRELETTLDGPAGNWGYAETRRWFGIKDEIGAGWFYWLLREAAARAGHHGSAREAETFYRRIAAEVNAAIDQGRIPGRRVPFSFVDPDFGNFLPHLPASFRKMWWLFVSTQIQAREPERPGLRPEVRELFDRVANRRTAPATRVTAAVSGWVRAAPSPVRQVVVQDAAGKVIGEALIGIPGSGDSRSPAAAGSAGGAGKAGFVIDVAASEPLESARLVFRTVSGGEMVVPLRDVASGRELQAEDAGAGIRMTCAIEKIDLPKMHALTAAMQSLAWRWHGPFTRYLGYLGLVAAALVALLRRSSRQAFDSDAVLLLLFLVVISRVALFALIDASSWAGNQPRYLFPVLPVFDCFLVFLLARAWHVLGERLVMLRGIFKPAGGDGNARG